MKRAERHIKTNKREFDDLALKSKNLYNKANYVIRQEFINNSNWIRYYELDKLCKTAVWQEYLLLPAQTSQQILKLLDQNWKSFFQAIKKWKKNHSLYLGRPRLPKYIKNNKNLIIFTNQQIKLKSGYIYFPKKANLKPIKTKVTTNIYQVRIIPKYTCYVVEVIYEKKTNRLNNNLNQDLNLGIDIGVNNLAAIVSNLSLASILIHGRPLKSINQFFNKHKAKLMSFIGNTGTSNRIEKLTHKRNQKINDYLHKSSRFIVNYANENNIGTIVIGKNNGWKNGIKIGKRNNQNFVNLPFCKLIQQIEYKAEEFGIKTICNEESYTSKCDALALESVEKHATYKGKRIKRGLFRSSTGRVINADINGAANILRKVVPRAFANGIEALGLPPLKIQFS